MACAADALCPRPPPAASPRMQTRSQKRRRSTSDDSASAKHRLTKRRIVVHTVSLPDTTLPLDDPQPPAPAFSTAPRVGSPFESTFSGTPSPAPSNWGAYDLEPTWVSPVDSVDVHNVHSDFLHATQGMKIDDSPADPDTDMDSYVDESMDEDHPALSLPHFHIHPPTPVIPLPAAVSSRGPGDVGSHRTLPSGVRPSTAGSPKKKFTMGPKENCEKCRLKVPGHYGHIDNGSTH